MIKSYFNYIAQRIYNISYSILQKRCKDNENESILKYHENHLQLGLLQIIYRITDLFYAKGINEIFIFTYLINLYNIIAKQNLNQQMSHILNHSESIQQGQCQKQREPSHSESSDHKINAEAEKNKRWNQVQHIQYLIFLQKNREKIKSKLIRRSNSFFREMSFFIISKSPIQCRSYHQKYEGKHKYPHRIIRQQKVKINVTLYEHLLREIQEKIQKDLIPFMKKDQAQKTQTTIEKKQTRQIEIQTDIQGIDTMIIPQNHASQTYNSGIFSPQIYQNYYSNFVWMNCRQHAYPFWN